MMQLLPDPRDLVMIGESPGWFARRASAATLLAALGGLAVVIVLGAAGAQASPLGVLLILVTPPVVAWWSVVRSVRTRAQRMRADMDLAVAAFLDLVNVLLAGGAGVETAMIAAAGAGGGSAFERIRLALARARSSRTSYWDSLAELGDELGVDALEEVANSVQLAGEHGARVRQSLVAKAAALRSRNLARIEHEAQRRTEHMGTPVVVLFVGFILLVGYPAFTASIGAL
jgi:Flp pilus assembly protein TadB